LLNQLCGICSSIGNVMVAYGVCLKPYAGSKDRGCFKLTGGMLHSDDLLIAEHQGYKVHCA
jgi:hypothetical protein